MQPLLAGGRSGGEWVAETFRSVLPLSAMERRRLDELQERLHQLQLELTVLREAESENHELRRALNLAPPAGWLRVPALVVARDPISWDRRFRIDHGSLDGVSAGNLVLVGERAVGRVVEVAARTAMVATVLDPRCRLSVRLSDSRVTGVLLGGHQRDPATGREVAMIDFLPRDALYRETERVETSGLSGYAPGGIVVGQVVKWDNWRVAEIVDMTHARLKVAPAADLTDFRVVSVLVPERREP